MCNCCAVWCAIIAANEEIKEMVKKLKITYALFVLLFFGATICAQDGNGVNMVNSIYDYWYDLNQVGVSDDYVYVASGRQGVRIVDVSDVQSPRQASVVDVDGSVQGVAVDGDYAYAISADPTALQVIDVSSPETPELISTVELEGSGWEIEKQGNLVIIAAGKISRGVNDDTPAVLIVDVSDPFEPAVLEAFGINDGYTRTLSSNDNFVFATDYRAQRITTIDISNQDSIFQVGTIQIHAQVSDISVTETVGCIVARNRSLYVYDVSEPLNRISEFGRIDFQESVYKIEINERFAFCIGDNFDNRESWLYVVDIEDPSNPQLIDDLHFDFPIEDLSLRGDFVYLTTHFNGMIVFDVSDPASIQQVSSIGEYGEIGGIVINNNRAFVVDSENGMFVLDISDPVNPRELAKYETSGQMLNVFIRGDVAFIADGLAGMLILDISDLENIQEIGSFEMGGFVGDVVVSGDYAYVAATQNSWQPVGEGLWVVDVSDLSNPHHVGRVRIPCSTVAISGNYAYVTGMKIGLWTLEISNPEDPLIVNGIYSEGIGSALEIMEETLFWADGDVLWQYNISNPEDIVLSRQFRTGLCYDFDISGELLFATNWNDGLELYDISNEDNQHLLGNFSGMNMYPAGIAIAGQYAYVAGRSGIAILDCSEAMNLQSATNNEDIQDFGDGMRFGIVGCYPNPFNAEATIVYNLPGSEYINLQIFDMHGRIVADLENGYASAGVHEVTWNASSNTGGMYIVRYASKTKTETQRILLVK